MNSPQQYETELPTERSNLNQSKEPDFKLEDKEPEMPEQRFRHEST